MTTRTIRISFHENFRDFFKRGRSLVVDYPLTRKAPVKDILESLGVPHTEIGSILSNGKDVDFDFRPAANGRLSVHPVVPPLDIRENSRLRPHPFTALKFIVDENVVKLGVFMRILGIDTACYPGISDTEIAKIAKAEKRAVLSRDVELFKRKDVVFGRYIRAVHPVDQVREVTDFFRLDRPFRLFSRCLDCNTPLVPVSKESVFHRLEPKTKLYFDEFSLCPTCDKIFWKGSHHEHMVETFRSAGVL